jgi:biotin carboxylase
MTILCLASYDKGHDFIRECKRQGATVLLVTSLSLQSSHQFPLESIDEIFFMPDADRTWDRTDLFKSVSYIARHREIDRIVPLDDFDVEVAAALREHLRVPGMGETTARYFRDKLAMRMKARDEGIPVPEFVHVLNHGRIQRFMDRVPPPWVLKPRSMAGAIGIQVVQNQEQFWPLIDTLGDMQSHYLLEQFVTGDVFHVDTIVLDGEPRFAIASGYGSPPMEVAHQGDVFTTRILERDSPLTAELLRASARVLSALGMRRGVSHTEFILGRGDGTIYFLETSARVGGAHIAELVDAASGLNLWAEWAKLELRPEYVVPPPREDYAGLLVSLAKQPHPDTSAYTDPEIVWRMEGSDAKEYHVGLIVRSHSASRVKQLLASYAERVKRDFWAYLPPREKPTH